MVFCVGVVKESADDGADEELLEEETAVGLGSSISISRHSRLNSSICTTNT